MLLIEIAQKQHLKSNCLSQDARLLFLFSYEQWSSEVKFFKWSQVEIRFTVNLWISIDMLSKSTQLFKFLEKKLLNISANNFEWAKTRCSPFLQLQFHVLAKNKVDLQHVNKGLCFFVLPLKLDFSRQATHTQEQSSVHCCPPAWKNECKWIRQCFWRLGLRGTCKAWWHLVVQIHWFGLGVVFVCYAKARLIGWRITAFQRHFLHNNDTWRRFRFTTASNFLVWAMVLHTTEHRNRMTFSFVTFHVFEGAPCALYTNDKGTRATLQYYATMAEKAGSFSDLVPFINNNSGLDPLLLFPPRSEWLRRRKPQPFPLCGAGGFSIF